MGAVVRLFSFTVLFSSLSPLSSSSPSCALQAQFRLNRMYKAGDVLLGGLVPNHFSSVFPERTFTSKDQDPTCHV